MQESRVKQETANKYAEDIQSIDYHIKTQYNVLERLQKDQENLAVRSVKLKESCSDQIQHSHQLADENKLLEKDIGRKNQGLAKLHTETKKIVKIREILAKKIRALEEKKHDIDNQRRQAKMANEGQVDEITRARRQVDIYKRTIDDFERERGLIDDEHAKTCANTQKNIQLMYPFKVFDALGLICSKHGIIWNWRLRDLKERYTT
jgi:DNA repair exonuclease SbcCD ATPase subunit